MFPRKLLGLIVYGLSLLPDNVFSIEGMRTGVQNEGRKWTPYQLSLFPPPPPHPTVRFSQKWDYLLQYSYPLDGYFSNYYFFQK